MEGTAPDRMVLCVRFSHLIALRDPHPPCATTQPQTDHPMGRIPYSLCVSCHSAWTPTYLCLPLGLTYCHLWEVVQDAP